MDHKFLWCATSIVLNKMMCNTQECGLQSKISITQASVQYNEYTYTVVVDECIYEFKYKFDSNTFAAGSLAITNTSRPRNIEKYVVRRSGDNIRIYKNFTDYTEIHDYNHTQLVAIHVVNNKKHMVDSVAIVNREMDVNHTEYCDVIVTSYSTPGTIPNTAQLHFDLFAVSGAIDKFSTDCPDVVTVRAKQVKMSFYNDTASNIIVVDSIPKPHDSNGVGKITVINSDFMQEYSYTFDDMDGAYEVTEYVDDRNGKRIEKRHYVYKENDGIITIPDHNLTFRVITRGTDVKFVRC